MQTGLDAELFAFVVLILSIIIHEVAHGYAAYALGDPTAKLAGRLTLNPIPHIDLMGSIIVPLICVLSFGQVLFGWAKPVPYNPYNLRNQRWGEAIVAVSGVATNLALAVLFGLGARYAYSAGWGSAANAAGLISLVNLSLGFFNLIPIPPFDGFSVLRGVLPYRAAIPLRQLEERLRGGGFITLILVLLAFSYFLSGPFSALIEWAFSALVGR